MQLAQSQVTSSRGRVTDAGTGEEDDGYQAEQETAEADADVMAAPVNTDAGDSPPLLISLLSYLCSN